MQAKNDQPNKIWGNKPNWAGEVLLPGDSQVWRKKTILQSEHNTAVLGELRGNMQLCPHFGKPRWKCVKFVLLKMFLRCITNIFRGANSNNTKQNMILFHYLDSNGDIGSWQPWCQPASLTAWPVRLNFPSRICSQWQPNVDGVIVL